MTIYTKARLTAQHNICEGGTERTAAALERLGLTMDSKVTMQLILRELGLSDTLFSFCAVCKGCEIEADKVLHAFMLEVTGLACRWLLLMNPTYVSALERANAAINKRCRGLKRPELNSQIHKEIKALQDEQTNPQDRYWLSTYLCMLSHHPDYLAATHGAIALMDGAAIVNMRDEIHAHLVSHLTVLLGPDPHYTEPTLQ